MEPYTEHTVTYDGDRHIFYIAAGPVDGPLIIFMHGWPSIGKTWHPQLQAFASRGFRVIAPDMPGYGRSTARNVPTDYALPLVIEGMLAVLGDTGRDKAVWVGHDWGCATLWTLANTHPEVCRAVAGICVPYASLELGLDELISTVDRDIYPVDKYPYGQWSYQVFYNESFEKAESYFNNGIPNALRIVNRKGDPAMVNKPMPHGSVVEGGGWYGGAKAPPDMPGVTDAETAHDEDIFQEVVAAMEKTGFGPSLGWYVNHDANRQYNEENTKHDGRLLMPVHFVHASYDAVCYSITGKFAEKMRDRCDCLTESVVDGGHWVAAEKREETNAALVKWMSEEVKDWWPSKQ